MGMMDDESTVYCDIQMPVAPGRELMQLVSTLKESNAHSTLSKVFGRIQPELSTSIDIKTYRLGAHCVSGSSFL